jgi:hypothetical protein
MNNFNHLQRLASRLTSNCAQIVLAVMRL